ncbi:MAG: sugar transferase, partial [Monoglobaceae bacterium]
RNELSFEEWVNLDIHYIMHRSFLMDIKIIFRTIWVMFREEGR